MAAYRLAVLALVLCLVQQCQGQPKITVTPTQINLTPNTTSIGGTVTVRCEPPPTGVRTLLGLVIYRVLHSNPNAPRVEVVAAGSDQNNGNASLIPGSSVTGTVDGSISQNFISLTMSQAKCRDGGMYICEASYFKTGTGNIVETVDVSRNLTVEVTPGAISLFATPSGVTTWTVNETLTLICNGPVGTVEGNTQVTWNWQYRKTTDSFVDWRPYDGPNSDIQDGATTKPDPCYENRISVLTRSLMLDDTSRIYRCFITKGQEYSQFAAEFSVGTVTTRQGQPRITVTPTQLTLTPNTTSIGGTVTVKCEPPSTGVRILLGLIIYRVLHSNPNAPRVEVVSAGSDQNNGNPSLIPGSSVTGTVDGSISQNFISLTMSQAKCRDGGLYICEASYFKTGTGNIVETDDVSRNLTVEVSPGAISLFAAPSGVTTWTVYETLTLTCNGPVGTVEGNRQVTWNWQYRKTTDSFVDWRPYDGPNSDIQDGATTKPDPCYENRISVLTRSLTLDDTSRIYRCFITKGQEYSQFAAEFSVGTVTTPATPATISTTSPAMTSTTAHGAKNSTQQEPATISTKSPAMKSTTADGASNSTQQKPDNLLGPVLGSVLAVSLLLNIGGVIVFW